MTQQCSRCLRKFNTKRDCLRHIVDKHKGQGESLVFRKPPQDEDESIADRMVQAEIDRACGIPNDDIKWLLPWCERRAK